MLFHFQESLFKKENTKCTALICLMINEIQGIIWMTSVSTRLKEENPCNEKRKGYKRFKRILRAFQGLFERE